MALDTIGLTRELVTLVRENITQFGSRVGGTSEFVALRQSVEELAVPYCFIIPTGRTSVSEAGNTAVQQMDYRFSTIICVSNISRNRSELELNSIEQIEYLLYRLCQVFYGRFPESTPVSGYIRFVNDHIDEMLPERLWWQINWKLIYNTDASDPEFFPSEDVIIETVFTRGFPNGVEAQADIKEDYNTKNELGLYEGGDGVVGGDGL